MLILMFTLVGTHFLICEENMGEVWQVQAGKRNVEGGSLLWACISKL